MEPWWFHYKLKGFRQFFHKIRKIHGIRSIKVDSQNHGTPKHKLMPPNLFCCEVLTFTCTNGVPSSVFWYKVSWKRMTPEMYWANSLSAVNSSLNKCKKLMRCGDSHCAIHGGGGILFSIRDGYETATNLNVFKVRERLDRASGRIHANRSLLKSTFRPGCAIRRCSFVLICVLYSVCAVTETENRNNFVDLSKKSRRLLNTEI